MRFMAVQRLCLLVHLFYSTFAEDPPPVVLITPVDSTPVTFRSQVATFGDQFQYGRVFQPLLMLPPDDLSLCVFPTTLENITMADAANLTMDRPIALLVARGNCTFGQKALVIAGMQERLTPFLRYMIVYNTNSSQPDDLIYMSSNSTSRELDGVGAMFLSWNSGVEMRKKVNSYSNQTGLSSIFLSETSRAWDLKVNLEVVHPKDDPGDGSTESEPSSMKNAFYSLRFVLFTLLIVSPCIRAGYLWYSSGGRVLLRRDENGRVTGLQYVSPTPYWFAAGSDMHNEEHEVTVLTEEQVQALPELVYKRRAAEGDDAQNDIDDETEAGTVNNKKSSSSKIEPSSVNNTVDDEVAGNVGQAPGNDFTGGGADSETANESSDPELFTTCTMCSICIDEFEDGETIRILPKCNHGFHFDCIKPWLTERQSCCPLCKTDVLTPDALTSASDESQDSPA